MPRFIFFNRTTRQKIEGPVEMSDCPTVEHALNARYGSALQKDIGCEMEPTPAELDKRQRRMREEDEERRAKAAELAEAKAKKAEAKAKKEVEADDTQKSG